MRRIPWLTILLLCGVWGLERCKVSSGPEDITLKFLTAVQQMNYTEAKQYATSDSKAMLDALSNFQKMLPQSSQEKFKHEKFEVKDVQKSDSLAVVTYASNLDSTNKTLKLKKENGEWKVAFTKETILPELNKPLNESDSSMIIPDSVLQPSTPVTPPDSAVPAP